MFCKDISVIPSRGFPYWEMDPHSNIFACLLLASLPITFGQFYLQEGHIPDYYAESNNRIETIRRTFKPLCHSIKKEIELKDEEFDYMPSSYAEYICTRPERKDQIVTKESHMCTFPGFECVQHHKEMKIAKRRKGTEIWDFYTQKIASDCECMLPTFESSSGNIGDE